MVNFFNGISNKGDRSSRSNPTMFNSLIGQDLTELKDLTGDPGRSKISIGQLESGLKSLILVARISNFRIGHDEIGDNERTGVPLIINSSKGESENADKSEISHLNKSTISKGLPLSEFRDCSLT